MVAVVLVLVSLLLLLIYFLFRLCGRKFDPFLLLQNLNMPRQRIRLQLKIYVWVPHIYNCDCQDCVSNCQWSRGSVLMTSRLPSCSHNSASQRSQALSIWPPSGTLLIGKRLRTLNIQTRVICLSRLQLMSLVITDNASLLIFGGRGCSSVGRTSDRHAADAGSIPRCGKGFFC